MKYTTFGIKIWLTFLLLFPTFKVWAQEAKTLSAIEIIEKSQRAFYYPGNDLKAKVTMELITEDGKKRTRILTMLRQNDPGNSDQKYFIYFHEPGDVRRTAFMVWKYQERDDERWIFIPAVNMVRRIAAKDSRSSFVGSDFTYEDVSGRDLTLDTHTFLREEKLSDTDCFVIESVPKNATEYTKKLAWIDKQNFLPLKEEYYDVQNQLMRVFTAEKIETITVGEGESAKHYPTPIKRIMKNVKSGHRTEVTFNTITYDLGLENGLFSENALQNPPQQWIK